MPKHFARHVLLPEGWTKNVRIECNNSGFITNITKNVDARDCKILDGIVIPGMPNVHSHAFQRAMAGLTEYAANPDDNFWSWRDLMYKFALQLSPEDIGAIAAQLYLEMLKSGYTQVGEFHYLHNDINGHAYSDIAATSHSVINAALSVGIGITHIPVLYHFAGFDNKPADQSQRRFINDVDGIVNIIETLKNTFHSEGNVNFGLSHHSLRAVSQEMVIEATKNAERLIPDLPIHIHIAEQNKEIDDCVAHSGKRPVEYLYDFMDVNERWSLIHATHMNSAETKMVAESKAVAGLCPTTEANLGDGIFNLKEFIEHNGNFAIGSDSHISVSVTEELRLLEYGQRLKHQRRNLSHNDQVINVGTFLYKNCLEGGAQSLNVKTGKIAKDQRADFVVLKENHVLMHGKKDNQILDSFVFAGNENLIKDVIVAGKAIIQNGHHAKENGITNNYKRTLDRILDQ